MRYKRIVFYSYINKKWISYYENKDGIIKKDKEFKTKKEAKDYYGKKAEYKTKKESKEYVSFELFANEQKAVSKILKKAKIHPLRVSNDEIRKLKEMKKKTKSKVLKKKITTILKSLKHRRKKISRTGFIMHKITYVFQNRTSKSIWLGKTSLNELKEKLNKYRGGIDYIVLQSENFGTIEYPTTRKEVEKNLAGLLMKILDAYEVGKVWIYEEATLLLHKEGV